MNKELDQDENNEAQRILQNLKTKEELKKQRMKTEIRKHQQLLEKINFLYPIEGPIVPYIYFFKFLAKKPTQNETTINRLKINLPDTIVSGETDCPAMWFYTGQDGYVYRIDEFTAKNVSFKLSHFASADELVGVFKKPIYSDGRPVGNDITLINKRQLASTALRTTSNRSELNVLQKFIKSNGPKAYISRTCWRDQKTAYAWIITNKNDYYSHEPIKEEMKFACYPKKIGQCNIVYTGKGKHVEETAPYLENIVKYLNIHLNLKFEELIGDFIKDESGIWWLINIKGYKLYDKYPLIDIKLITCYEPGMENTNRPAKKTDLSGGDYKKLKQCKYCEQMYSEGDLLQRLSLQNIINLDLHMIHRGYGSKMEWLKRVKYFQSMDPKFLLQQHKICKVCFKLYKECEELQDIVQKFSKAIGIPVEEFSKYNIQGVGKLDNMESVMSQVKNESQSYLEMKNSKQESLNILQRYRLMIFINLVQDVPLNINPNSNVFIEYTFMKQPRVRVKLNMHHVFKRGKGFMIPVNNLRIFYFFLNQKSELSSFLYSQQNITMSLYFDNKKMGEADFNITNFASQEQLVLCDYIKFFNGKELFPYLSWGINVQIGIKQDGVETIDKIKIEPLNEFNNVFVAQQDYYTSSPLPLEWIAIINEKNDNECITNVKPNPKIKDEISNISKSSNQNSQIMITFSRQQQILKAQERLSTKQSQNGTVSNLFGSPKESMLLSDKRCNLKSATLRSQQNTLQNFRPGSAQVGDNQINKSSSQMSLRWIGKTLERNYTQQQLKVQKDINDISQCMSQSQDCDEETQDEQILRILNNELVDYRKCSELGEKKKRPIKKKIYY